jgi:mannonate dehydratase
MTPRPLVVTHLPHVAPGEIWPVEDLRKLRAELTRNDLSLGPIESVFWTDAMKLGQNGRDLHLENYRQTLKNLRIVFPEPDELIVTYNLMPLDWGRTALAHMHSNGTRGLAYDHQTMNRIDLSDGLFLPGWSRRYSLPEFSTLERAYSEQGVDGFWQNVGYALRALVPSAAEQGIRLAAHPNDPPWSYLGLPAFLCNGQDIRRLLALYPHRSNALCFCTGSYGAEPGNNIPGMIQEFSESIAWMHIRAVKTTGEKSFHEADHADLTANVDLLAVMRTLVKIGWDGIFRSDHGLDLLHESESNTNGYPAIDRYVANKMLWAYERALQCNA